MRKKCAQLVAKAADGDLLVPANFNCPGQIVLSGTKSACERAERLAAEFGAIKAVVLRVAGAFHSNMMSPAADALKDALAKTNISMPAVKVIANISADYYSSAQEIREGLTNSLYSLFCGRIVWKNCSLDGVETFYEIGPGRVLTGLMRKIDRRANIINISGAESLKELNKERCLSGI